MSVNPAANQLSAAMLQGTPWPDPGSASSVLTYEESVNPADGAILRSDSSRIQAIAPESGAVLTLYPNSMALSYEHGGSEIDGLSDGTVVAQEDGDVVDFEPGGNIDLMNAHGRPLMLGTLKASPADLKHMLVDRGILSEATLRDVMDIENNGHNFEKIHELPKYFDETTLAAMVKLKDEIAQRRWNV